MITKTQKYLFSKLPKKLYKNIIVDITSGCWLWQVNINGGGYGRVSVSTNGNKKRIAAHIYIYKLLKGDYQKDLVLDHVYCKDRNCCNPAHLSPVTTQVNVSRGSGALFKKKVIPFKLPAEPEPYLEDLLAGYAYLQK